MTIKKLTAFSKITTPEGVRIVATYAEINDKTGKMTNSNVKESYVVLDDKVLEQISALEDLIMERYGNVKKGN